MGSRSRILYGDIRLKNEWSPDFAAVYPLLKFTDVQGGPGRLSPGGGLNHFTGCAGGSIYRGDALPKDLYGDYILPEPVGRLIRRAKITNEDGSFVLSNAYDKKEFMASTDANFRPVWTRDRARRIPVHLRHVPRHHPGIELDQGRLVPPPADPQVRA